MPQRGIGKREMINKVLYARNYIYFFLAVKDGPK